LGSNQQNLGLNHQRWVLSKDLPSISCQHGVKKQGELGTIQISCAVWGRKKTQDCPIPRDPTLDEAAIAKLNGLNGDLKRIEDRLVRQGSESKVEILS